MWFLALRKRGRPGVEEVANQLLGEKVNNEREIRV